MGATMACRMATRAASIARGHAIRHVPRPAPTAWRMVTKRVLTVGARVRTPALCKDTSTSSPLTATPPRSTAPRIATSSATSTRTVRVEVPVRFSSSPLTPIRTRPSCRRPPSADCPDGLDCYSSTCAAREVECAWDTWTPIDGGGSEWNQGFVRSDTKGGRGPFQPGQYVPCRAKNVVFWEGFHAVKGSTENLECSGRGLCDHSTGACNCFSGYGSSDGEYGEGIRGDCSWEMPFGTTAGDA